MIVETQPERNEIECCGCDWPTWLNPTLYTEYNQGEFTPPLVCVPSDPTDCNIYKGDDGNGNCINPWTFAELIAEAQQLKPGYVSGGGFPAFTDQFYQTCSGVDYPLYAGVNDVRYRWTAPNTGKYFKIAWDEVTFGTDTESNIGNPALMDFVAVNAKSEEWTDGPKSYGAWHEVLAPTSAYKFTETYIYNFRFWCYRDSRCGTKPQIFGEAYEIPT